jgi:hypothetical protein
VTSLLTGGEVRPELAPLAPGRFGRAGAAARRHPEAVAR